MQIPHGAGERAQPFQSGTFFFFTTTPLLSWAVRGSQQSLLHMRGEQRPRLAKKPKVQLLADCVKTNHGRAWKSHQEGICQKRGAGFPPRFLFWRTPLSTSLSLIKKQQFSMSVIFLHYRDQLGRWSRRETLAFPPSVSWNGDKNSCYMK